MDNNKFYLIGVNYKNSSGLMGIAFFTLYYIEFAIEQGYIPIVDMQHYTNPYFKDNREFKDNVWEYYFEQPCGYNISDIDDASEVRFCDPDVDFRESFIPFNSDYPVELTDWKLDSRLQKFKEYFNKYIRFNTETKQYLEERYKTIIGNETEVLGVFARGTDYMMRRTSNHRIQPTAKQLINKVKNVLKNYPEIKKIYLATEDLDIYNEFKAEFKDILLDNGQVRISYKDEENKYKFLNQVRFERENHNYHMGLEYLTSLYILSKCKYFVGGRAGGSYAVCYLSEGFKYYYSFNLGKYGRGHEHLFSVITENNKKCAYKVYNILGLKFKIKI